MNTSFGDGIPFPPISRPNRYKLISRVALCSVVFIVLFLSSITIIYLFKIKFHAPPSITRISNDELLVESPITSKNLIMMFYVRNV
jgi:hypothetical protein